MFRCTVCSYLHQGSEPPAVCPVCGVGPDLFEPCGEAAAAVAAGRARDGVRLVILGAGAAGCAAAEAARRQDPSAAIALVGAEPGLPYRRVDLTRLLAGAVLEGSLPLHPPGWFADRGIERLHARAVGLDLAGGRVALGDGRGLPFDALVLATGAHAIVPPIPGVTREGVAVLRSLDDARRLLRALRPGRPVAVIGGGLLGMEAAAGLARRGVEVTVLESQGWLLPRQLPEPAGRLLADHLARLGVEVRCGVRVEALAGDEDLQAVRLAGGIEIPADVALLCAGVRPNAGLAARAGLAVDRGVRVDEGMRTSHPAVWAAGDVAEHGGRIPGLWTVAEDQGRVAGGAAAGGAARFLAPAPIATLKVLDLAVTSLGDVEGAGADVLEEQAGGRYLRLVARGGGLVGGCLVGHADLVGPLGQAVREGRRAASLADLRAGLAENGPTGGAAAPR